MDDLPSLPNYTGPASMLDYADDYDTPIQPWPAEPEWMSEPIACALCMVILLALALLAVVWVASKVA